MNELDETNPPPPVLEAVWDHDQIGDLFDDLQNGAEIQHVQVRTATHDGTQDITTTLDRAHRLLTSGEAKAIQIRYEFDARLWCDTLIVSPAAVRIIRTCLD